MEGRQAYNSHDSKYIRSCSLTLSLKIRRFKLETGISFLINKPVLFNNPLIPKMETGIKFLILLITRVHAIAASGSILSAINDDGYTKEASGFHLTRRASATASNQKSRTRSFRPAKRTKPSSARPGFPRSPHPCPN